MSEDQLQPEDSLLDRGVDDVLDEGFSPPDRARSLNDKSITARGEIEGETLDERIAQEEPEVWAEAEAERDADVLDGPVGGEVGEERAGRLASDGSDVYGTDVGVDGAGASAEEAAMHVIDD